MKGRLSGEYGSANSVTTNTNKNLCNEQRFERSRGWWETEIILQCILSFTLTEQSQLDMNKTTLAGGNSQPSNKADKVNK
eukprot:scaffold14974_cov195-Amphora_coffeaeformis.AAC.17